MLMIKFVLCAVSKTVSNKNFEKIHENVTNNLQICLKQMTKKVYESSIFNVHDEHYLGFQIEVMYLSTICIKQIYIYMIYFFIVLEQNSSAKGIGFNALGTYC